MINGTIEVKVVDVKGGRVKLGFEYPEGNSVYRQELYDKIMTENKHAAENISPEKLGSFLKNLPKTTVVNNNEDDSK